MFLKLWKYEIKCSYRSYVLMYAVLLLASLFINTNSSFINSILTLIYTLMIVITVIMTMVLVIRNYNQSMFQRPGYLTMTLPVSTQKIVLVKILNATLTLLVSYFVIALSVLILICRIGAIDLGAIGHFFGTMLHEIPLEGWLVFVNLTLSLLQFICITYFIITFTHSCYVRKHRGVIAFVIFVVFNILLSFINDTLLGGTISGSMFFQVTETTYRVSNMQSLIFSLVENLILIVGAYFATSYFLDHKLEME